MCFTIAIEFRAHDVLQELLSDPSLREYIDDTFPVSLGPQQRKHNYSALSMAVSYQDEQGIRILLDNGADPTKIDIHCISENHLDGCLEYPFRAYLENNGLSSVVERILKKKASDKVNDILFFDPINDDAESWEIKITNVGGDLSDLLTLMDGVVTNSGSISVKLYLQLLSPFLERLDIDVLTATREHPTSLDMNLAFWKYERIENFPWSLSDFLKGVGLYGADRTRNINKDLRIIMDAPIGFQISQNTRKGLDVSKSRHDASVEQFTARLDSFCFDDTRAFDTGIPDYDKGRGYVREGYNPARSLKLLENFPKWVESGDVKIESLLHWARCIHHKEFHRKLCDLALLHLSIMTRIQISSFLRLAAHCDFYDVTETILQTAPDFWVPNDVLCEATWFAGMKTFNILISRYSPEHGAQKHLTPEILLLAAVILGQFYKVVKLLPHAEIDFEFKPGRTVLFVAVELGRLDITKLLLKAGAVKHIDICKEEAMGNQNFAIESLLQHAIDSQLPKNTDGSAILEDASSISTPGRLNGTEEFLSLAPPEDLWYNTDDYSEEALKSWIGC
ncbi:hypothetical protein H072_2056 [Dactylellina haptotyla CBS 200.50]|uniref:Ankyrin repeat protein n=1 Tax=Dactylellina haptotyla (strain CBS 200.50) TaxID=1284197 RepID=S8AS74_DACHA|nr:hypothetical protein H072_2056 [Dactylellina haptotyla CBS 200.50]